MDLEQKLKLRIRQYSGSKEYPEGYLPKAAEIQRRYDEQGFNTKNKPFAHWEEAGQMASKLLVVLDKPDKIDQRKKYEQALREFDMETGKFPENIDPRTGEIKE